MKIYIVVLNINNGSPHIKAFENFDRAYNYMMDDVVDQAEAYNFEYDEIKNKFIGDGEIYCEDETYDEPTSILKAQGDTLRWDLKVCSL